jgi:hypothetical protein
VCGRATYDPDKREGYWTRGVRGGHLVLICPSCQLSREWRSQLDRCEQCGSVRLSVTLGEIVCRDCGHLAGSAREEDGSLIGPGA